MSFIAIKKDVLINSEAIVSVEKRNGKIKVNLEGGLEYFVDILPSELIKEINSSGIDLTKQFLAV